MLKLARQVGTTGTATHSRTTTALIGQNHHILSRHSDRAASPYNLLMKTHRSHSLQPSHIDNFSVRSKPADNAMVEPKEERIRRRERAEEVGRNKQFLINGVDFHAGEIVVGRQGELLEDAFSVKGDYFYLKRGEIVNVRFAIGEYVEIKFEQKVGYFPTRLLRLIGGERWHTK